VEGSEGRDACTVTFRYRSERSDVLGTVKRPVARIYFKDHEGRLIPCFMYIDSGADFTLIPYRFGLMMGFEVERKVHEVYGVGGEIPVILKSTLMRLNENELKVRIGWSLREDVPFILGRLDVFDRFNIEFREKEEMVIFKFIG